jgi:putative methionine-R-sulfoxide reductase with GAF domain
VLDELVHLFEGAFVEQEVDAFPDGKFALTVLAFAALGPSAFFGRGMAAPEFIQTIHQSSEYRGVTMSLLADALQSFNPPASSAEKPQSDLAVPLGCAKFIRPKGDTHMSAAATAANYVLTLEEIRNLTREGGKPAETLMNLVALIARRFHTDVCSAYLLEPDRANLVLAATLGLRKECIGTLRLALHEGLAGLVAEQVHPVAVEKVSQHPRYKYFLESGEEQYHSFLGVPLIDRGVLQGVLVVQTIDSRVFLDDEIRMLMDAAKQVAPVVSEARTLDRFVAPAQERLWALARNLWWSWDHD